MADPYRIFASEPGRAESLKVLWPELYACLSRTDGADPAAARSVRCTVGRHEGKPLDAPLATGRVSLNGPPACPWCLRKMCTRPGGFPLKLTDPRELRVR